MPRNTTHDPQSEIVLDGKHKGRCEGISWRAVCGFFFCFLGLAKGRTTEELKKLLERVVKRELERVLEGELQRVLESELFRNCGNYRGNCNSGTETATEGTVEGTTDTTN